MHAADGLAAIAALCEVDDLPTIMKALATTLGIGGKWKPNEFVEKVAAHLGVLVPPGKVRAAQAACRLVSTAIAMLQQRGIAVATAALLCCGADGRCSASPRRGFWSLRAACT